METAYKAVNFSKHDIIMRSDLDQINANLRWVYENTPRGRHYRESGEPRPENLLIIAGKAKINQDHKRESATVAVKFGESFAPNCNPSITTGVVADFQRKIFCVVHGPGSINYPTAQGFQISVNIAAGSEKNDIIKKDFWVHWCALGYRKDDMNEF